MSSYGPAHRLMFERVANNLAKLIASKSPSETFYDAVATRDYHLANGKIVRVADGIPSPTLDELLARLQPSFELSSLPLTRPVQVTINGKPASSLGFKPNDPQPRNSMPVTAPAKNRVIADRPLSRVTATFFDELEREVYETIGDAIIKHDEEIDRKLKQIDETLRTRTAKLEVKVGEVSGIIDGIRHRQLDSLLSVAVQRLPVMLVGVAGSGKTHAAAQVADGLNLPFYAMSVGAQTSKSDIIGFMHAGGEYVPTLFKKAYEDGGVFLMDEIDAGNANVLILVNAALSNDYCAFPQGMVKRHPDFVFIASANTFGNGANRQYVGRNQLDAATLDRFALIEWMIDDKLEAALAGSSVAGKRWYEAVKRVRAKVESEGMRVLVTPRATMRGAKLLAADVPLTKAADIALFNLFPADKRQWARDIAKISTS